MCQQHLWCWPVTKEVKISYIPKDVSISQFIIIKVSVFVTIVHPVTLLVPNRNNYEEIKYFVTRSSFHFLTWCCWKVDWLSTSQTALYLQPASPGILSDAFTKGTNVGSVEDTSCLEAHITSRNLSNASQSNRDSTPGFCLPGASWYSSVTSCPAVLSCGPSPPCDCIPRSLTLDSFPHAASLMHRLWENEMICQTNEGICIPFPSLSTEQRWF